MNMKKDKFTNELIDFINDGSCAFTTVNKIKEILLDNDFKELEETDIWDLKAGNYFTTRNDATIIAFSIPQKYDQRFAICSTHCDTPALTLKASGEYFKNDYMKFNIMPYGGLLNYGWLDRPLSVAGRIIIKKNNELEKKIIDYKKPIAIVPSLAIHQNDKANTNLDLNMQIDLQPIITLKNDNNLSFLEYLNKELQLKGKIKDYDLFFYNCEEPQIIGFEKNILLAPRIDNLTSTFAGLQGFLDNNSKAINVYVTFNNEEIGSLTKEGAESSFLLDILKRIATSLNLDLAKTLANSFVISSDNTHAIHPNHAELMDETGNLKLNEGLAIIKEINSTTDGYFSSIFKEICEEAQAKYQDSTFKNDLSSGSTLSGLSLRHVSISSIDIGIPQLAMHSSFEVCGLDDVYDLYLAISKFYQTDIIINKEKTKLIFH